MHHHACRFSRPTSSAHAPRTTACCCRLRLCQLPNSCVHHKLQCHSPVRQCAAMSHAQACCLHWLGFMAIVVQPDNMPARIHRPSSTPADSYAHWLPVVHSYKTSSNRGPTMPAHQVSSRQVLCTSTHPDHTQPPKHDSCPPGASQQLLSRL